MLVRVRGCAWTLAQTCLRRSVEEGADAHDEATTTAMPIGEEQSEQHPLMPCAKLLELFR